MTTMINLSGFQNATTVVDLVIYANTVTENLLGGFLITAVFFIMMVGLVRGGNKFIDALLVTSYVCLIFSFLGRYLGFVSVFYVLFLIIITAVSSLLVYINKKKG